MKIHIFFDGDGEGVETYLRSLGDDKYTNFVCYLRDAITEVFEREEVAIVRDIVVSFR